MPICSPYLGQCSFISFVYLSLIIFFISSLSVCRMGIHDYYTSILWRIVTTSRTVLCKLVIKVYQHKNSKYFFCNNFGPIYRLFSVMYGLFSDNRRLSADATVTWLFRTKQRQLSTVSVPAGLFVHAPVQCLRSFYAMLMSVNSSGMPEEVWFKIIIFSGT